MLKLTMDYKMTNHMLDSCTLKESRTWLLVCTRHCYFIPFNHEHPVFFTDPPEEIFVHRTFNAKAFERSFTTILDHPIQAKTPKKEVECAGAHAY